jgi:hypothetical protein
MKDYLQERQMELFIFGVLSDFITTEGYSLSEEQRNSVIEKSLGILKSLGYDQLVAVESEDKEELKLTIQKLATFSMCLFSLCVMHNAREEKYKEIITSLKGKEDND